MSTERPIENSINEKITKYLGPTYLKIMNESYMHNVPEGSETHFKLVVASDHFSTLPNVKRHQLVYKILAEELKNGVHALSIVAKTPQEFEEMNKDIDPSPNCRGGFGK